MTKPSRKSLKKRARNARRETHSTLGRLDIEMTTRKKAVEFLKEIVAFHHNAENGFFGSPAHSRQDLFWKTIIDNVEAFLMVADTKTHSFDDYVNQVMEDAFPAARAERRPTPSFIDDLRCGRGIHKASLADDQRGAPEVSNAASRLSDILLGKSLSDPKTSGED